MQRVLGIDLGTTNSVMAWVRGGEPRVIANRDNSDLTPSVVGRGKKGELLVGTSARSRSVVDPAGTVYSVKRLMGRRFADSEVQTVLKRLAYKVTPGDDGDVRVWMGNRDYTPIEMSALILRRLKEDAEERSHEPVTRAVITVPAYFGERQVAATREAGRMAGFHVMRIINEPTSAALAYGLAREATDAPTIVLVYDLGGGTFDISIIMLMQGAFTVLGIEGDNMLGGDDFDRLLIERLYGTAAELGEPHLASDKTAAEKVRAAAETAKIALSSQLATDVIVPALGASKTDIDTEITRVELEALVRPFIEKTITLAQKALSDSHLTAADIDQVLLVGGSTSIPLVSEMLGAAFGEDKLRNDVHPMLCVALGAAIQAWLLEDVECSACGDRNPIQNDDCASCSAPLYGRAKLDCPDCFMPCDEDAATCWKCGRTLDEIASPAKTARGSGADATSGPIEVPAAPPPPARQAQKCANCGKPLRPGQAACSICGQTSGVEDGLRCSICGEVNKAGAAACAACGNDVRIATSDITPKDLGIELNDGSMAVVLPKGTGYPTVTLHSRDFSTVIERQARLEVQVYEGSHPVAHQNELCGYITMPLPEGLSRGTPVTVSFGLDSDRTITVQVRVRVPGSETKVVRLQHFGRLDAEHQRLLDAKRAEVVAFVDRWAHELRPLETKVLYALVDEVDQALSGAGKVRISIDDLVSRVDASIDAATTVRAQHAYIGAVLFVAGKYLSEGDREELGQIRAQLASAREQADWAYGRTIADNAQAVIDSFGPAIRSIVFLGTFAAQDLLSPALSHRVIGVLREVDESWESGDDSRIAQAMVAMLEIWPEAQAEVGSDQFSRPSVSGLQ